VLPELLELLGSVGPGAGFIGILVWYILRREAAHRELNAELQTKLDLAQEKRVADAQQVVDRLLAITEKWHKLIEDLSRSLDSQASASEQMREAIDKLSERTTPRTR
jgi:methyl-accepting chemotaxis protein